jgi:neurotransmitter:Na+ symporter, NSS family
LSTFFLLLLLATWTSSINLAEPIVATLQGQGLGRGQAAAVIGVAVWLVGLLSVLSFSTLAEWRPLAGMNVFELMTTVPTEIFLPIGGLLIAVFAAWIMPQGAARGALGVGEPGFRLWLGVIRWVSIPLTVLVLAAGLL